MKITSRKLKTVLENCYVGIRKMVEDRNSSYRSTQHISIKVLSMKCVKARIVPKKTEFLFIVYEYDVATAQLAYNKYICRKARAEGDNKLASCF